MVSSQDSKSRHIINENGGESNNPNHDSIWFLHGCRGAKGDVRCLPEA